jgi:hypothetical protein
MDNERFYHPETSRTDQNLQKMTDMLRHDCHLLFWKITEGLNMNRETMQLNLTVINSKYINFSSDQKVSRKEIYPDF